MQAYWYVVWQLTSIRILWNAFPRLFNWFCNKIQLTLFTKLVVCFVAEYSNFHGTNSLWCLSSVRLLIAFLSSGRVFEVVSLLKFWKFPEKNLRWSHFFSKFAVYWVLLKLKQYSFLSKTFSEFLEQLVLKAHANSCFFYNLSINSRKYSSAYSPC